MSNQESKHFTTYLKSLTWNIYIFREFFADDSRKNRKYELQGYYTNSWRPETFFYNQFAGEGGLQSPQNM